MVNFIDTSFLGVIESKVASRRVVTFLNKEKLYDI